MSITLDYSDVNYMICKHLLECGYTHSAFTLEKESNLDPSLFKEKNIPAGFLIHNLEKAQILGRMEAHVHLDELHECNITYDLIKEHTCEITEKACQQREAAYKEIITTTVQERQEKTSMQAMNQNNINTLQKAKSMQAAIGNNNFTPEVKPEIAKQNPSSLDIPAVKEIPKHANQYQQAPIPKIIKKASIDIPGEINVLDSFTSDANSYILINSLIEHQDMGFENTIDAHTPKQQVLSIFNIKNNELKLEFLLPIPLQSTHDNNMSSCPMFKIREKLFCFKEDGHITIQDYLEKKSIKDWKNHSEAPKNQYFDKIARQYYILYSSIIHVLKADDFSIVTKIKGNFNKIEIREGVNIACLTSELKVVLYNYSDFENPVTLNHGICRISDIKYTSNDLFLTGRTENPISVLIWTSENVETRWSRSTLCFLLFGAE